ncbi:MAG TPA: hypothetical protein VMV45_10040 [Casimicrobiaceae bacterium]|nr:hypothetical protein [Casimicrobiaceae bacterium]
MRRRLTLEQRRDLLIAQAELDRIELRLAWQDVRNSVLPARWVGAAGRGGNYARVLAIVLPVIGLLRFRRVVATLGAALSLVRAVRAWRARSR